MKLETVEGLNDFIEYLIDLTIMPHETSPTGYTDPMEKQYRLGRRHALRDVQKFLAPPEKEEL